MALVQTSGLITDIRGSVGGCTFQNSRAGLVLKQKCNNVNRRTNELSSHRAILYQLQVEWGNLTQAKQSAWQTHALFGKHLQKNMSGKYINGQQEFIKINYYRLFYGQSIMTTPVFMSSWTDIFTINVGLFFGTLNLRIVERSLFGEGELILLLTYPISAGCNNPANRYRMIPVVTIDTQSYDITTLYTNIFGQIPPLSSYIYAKWSLSCSGNGQVLPFQTKKILIENF